MQKRYVVGGFFLVVIVVTALVSCLGHVRRADADPVARVQAY